MLEFNSLYKKYKDLEIHQSKEEFDALKIEFVYHSNKLEGSNLTLIQTQELIEHHFSKGASSFIDQLMALDHYRALDQALLFGSNKYPVSEKVIFALHETLLKNSYEIDPYYSNWKAKGQQLGTYKISANRIKVTLGEKEIFLETPLPEASEKMVKEAIEKYNNSTLLFLEKLGMLVQDIYNAHPFIDGNKRLTRLLIANQLMANGYPLMVINAESNDYNQALLKGMQDKNYTEITSVIIKKFSQYLASSIEKING